MGSNLTKLKKLCEKGDEKSALELYEKFSNDLKQKLNANSVINNDILDTWLHVTAKNGMFKFLKILIYQHNGLPTKLNKKNQNLLHKICQGSNDSTQLPCLNLIIEWKDRFNNDLLNVNDKDDVN